MAPKFIYVNELRNWFSAQKYCRENYIDLVCVKNEAENQKIHMLMSSTASVWIGLYRDANMFWSDGSDSSFRFWDSEIHPFGTLKMLCVAADMKQTGKWQAKTCDLKLPFFCYGAPRE
ncbi:hypothetical protein LDENG_00229240 [Lucifuga dentata]|nr:hypothetical protein LDENG_00229240 [Lucifuga dentata]